MDESQTAQVSGKERREPGAPTQGQFMPKKKKSAVEPYILYHKDGSVWGRGQKVDGLETGYWEWFRKDGTRMRSGYFGQGQQIGEWTTYDNAGAVFKVTNIKPKTQKK